MDSEQKDIRATATAPQSPAALPKKAYERPQIVYRAPLEAMAAVCTPAPPGKAFPGVDDCTAQFS